MRMRSIVAVIGASISLACSDPTGVGVLDGTWMHNTAKSSLFLTITSQGHALATSGSWWDGRTAGAVAGAGTIDRGLILLDLTLRRDWGVTSPTPSTGRFEGRQMSPKYIAGTLTVDGQASELTLQRNDNEPCASCVYTANGAAP